MRTLFHHLFLSIVFTLYTLSALALPRATKSHEKAENGRKIFVLACFRFRTLPAERRQPISTHPTPEPEWPSSPLLRREPPPEPEWPSSPLLRREPPPEPSSWLCPARQPPTTWASTDGAPGWILHSDPCCKWRHTCNTSGRAFGSGRRRRLHRTGHSAIRLQHPSYGLASCRAISAIPRRRKVVPL